MSFITFSLWVQFKRLNLINTVHLFVSELFAFSVLSKG